MKQGYLRQHGKSGMEMVEETCPLIRRASARALASYFIGTAPFLAGLLYFCSAMSRSAFASEDAVLGSLGLTLLFVWMKGWQARFTRVLIAEWAGYDAGTSLRRMVNTFVIQGIVQPSALFVLPIASLILVPFPWAYAFYQNVTALDDGTKDLGTVCRQAARQAALWPMQNNVLLLWLSAFGFFVFLNWLMFCTSAPELLQSSLGIETMASQNPYSMLNSTLVATVFGLTFLCVDPLLKGAYALRCFYGSSLQTGEDLKTELRFLSRGLAVVLAVGFLWLGTPASRADTPVKAPQTSETGRALDHNISEVLKQDKYAWRYAPAEAPVKAEKGSFRIFFEEIGKALGKIFDAVVKVLRKIRDFFHKYEKTQKPETESPSGDSLASNLWLLFGALIVVAAILGVVVMRTLKKRRAVVDVTATAAVTPVPDIADEYISADQFPEDQWTTYGRELMAKGDFRSAIRAFYLASLAHLGSVNLVTIARGKSNREYEKEVRRRGHALPELPPVFGEHVRVFDRAWYGLHEVNQEAAESFLVNLGKIKSYS